MIPEATVAERKKLRQKFLSPTVPEQEEQINCYNTQGQPTAQVGWWLQIPGRHQANVPPRHKGRCLCMSCSGHWWRACGPDTNTCPDSVDLWCFVSKRGVKLCGCQWWEGHQCVPALAQEAWEEQGEADLYSLGNSTESVSRETCRFS